MLRGIVSQTRLLAAGLPIGFFLTSTRALFQGLQNAPQQRTIMMLPIINNIIIDRSNSSSSRHYMSTKQLDKNNLFQGENETITVDGYSQQGFSVNGVLLPGPIVTMPNALFLWDVHACSEITADSLAVLSVIEPAIEFIIIGTGETRIPLDEQLVSEIKRRYNTAVEIMSTVNALGTYNIVSEEGRKVAAFLLPLEPCREAKDPYYVAKKDYLALEEEGSHLSSHRQRQQPKLPQTSQTPKFSFDDTNEPTSFQSEYKPTKNQEEAEVQKPSIFGKALIWVAEKLAPKNKK